MKARCLVSGLLAALAATAGAVHAQADCAQAADADQATLVGSWQAEFDGQRAGTLLLRKDPEYAETVVGTIERDGEHRRLAGDVDNGDFTLEESADGVHIVAAWLGEVVEGSCGREIRGTWKAEGAATGHAFILRKD
jgi:hypothetical protein